MQARDHAKAASLGVGCLVMAVAILSPCDTPDMGIGLYTGAPLYARLLHPLVHTGLVHAILNVYVWLQIVFFCPIRLRHLMTAWLIACSCPSAIATLGAAATDHVVGLSGVIYALLGAQMTHAKDPFSYNLWIAAYLLTGWLIGGTAVVFHLYCYLMGIIFRSAGVEE